ncbi:MAG: hypothetical protein NC937_04995 [Candidatus Omnitrophica bacterium]|nr:hypothetical protein [Candidatus Omnitrophota bacterium]MCM8825480.1 hypothetical protein [Candidatus Omnitrophota bacterium]
MLRKKKNVQIWGEIRHHLPFSILSVITGLILIGIFTVIAEMFKIYEVSYYSKKLFHIFHPTHILFSAIATTAMFWKHERGFLKTITIGFVGSAGICGISDIIIPYLSGFLLGSHMDLHVCIIEHPHLVLPFIFSGIVIGFLVPETFEKQEGVIFSHSLHIMVSASASILYLISFGVTDWISRIGVVYIYMVLAVVIPCCTSDIIFPLLFTTDEK